MPRADLFTIGEFSAITGVGIHSLRYYDEIGALKPEYVDPVSNYRYYGFRQLSLIPAIELCKDAGINLSNFDAFIVDGTVDYTKLLSESRSSLERKIDNYRHKQREIEQTGMLLSIGDSLNDNDSVTLHLDSINVWVTPLYNEPGEATCSDILRKLSSDARRHGQKITASTCGLMECIFDGEKTVCAFSQASGSASPNVLLNASSDTSQDTSPAKSDNQLKALPAGEYLIRPIDTFSIEAAKESFSGIQEATLSESVFALSFIGNSAQPEYCAAALISHE